MTNVTWWQVVQSVGDLIWFWYSEVFHGAAEHGQLNQ